MHPSSLGFMNGFVKKYVKQNDKVLDVGSAVVKGARNLVSYKVLFEEGFVEYTGLDIEEGRNVDLVVKDPYKWTEIQDNTYDVVISGQVLEHIEFFWLVFEEMTRVLKKGGFMCLIVPKYHLQHKHPVDCWRFLPDGMRALARYTKIKCLIAQAEHVQNYAHPKNLSNDCVGVFQK